MSNSPEKRPSSVPRNLAVIGFGGCGLTLAILVALKIFQGSFHSMEVGLIYVFMIIPLYLAAALCCFLGFVLYLGINGGRRTMIVALLLLVTPIITFVIGHALAKRISGHHHGVFRPPAAPRTTSLPPRSRTPNSQ